MKKLTFLVISLIITVFSLKAQSGASASATANVTAEVVQVITVDKTSDLNFGTFAGGSTSGTVSIETSGVRNYTGGTALLSTNLGNPATFTVHGQNQAQYFITLPSPNSIILVKSGTNNQMIVSSFVHNATGVLSGNGEEVFNVGAVLQVSEFQPAGLYEGTFNVIVTLQ